MLISVGESFVLLGMYLLFTNTRSFTVICLLFGDHSTEHVRKRSLYTVNLLKIEITGCFTNTMYILLDMKDTHTNTDTRTHTFRQAHTHARRHTADFVSWTSGNGKFGYVF